MLPEKIGDDGCSLARRWILGATLAQGLVRLERLAEQGFASSPFDWPGLWIVSGYRTPAHQALLNPAVEDSFHVRCPALAADLRVGSLPGQAPGALLQYAGGIWISMGFRWGGLFTDFPNPAHFDVGRT